MAAGVESMQVSAEFDCQDRRLNCTNTCRHRKKSGELHPAAHRQSPSDRTILSIGAPGSHPPLTGLSYGFNPLCKMRNADSHEDETAGTHPAYRRAGASLSDLLTGVRSNLRLVHNLADTIQGGITGTRVPKLSRFPVHRIRGISLLSTGQPDRTEHVTNQRYMPELTTGVNG